MAGTAAETAAGLLPTVARLLPAAAPTSAVFLVFTVVAVPETKGRTLEEISAYRYADRTWPQDAPR